MIQAFQLLLIIVVGVFVLGPLVRLRGQRIEREAAFANRYRSVLERKNRVYQQLVDLDFDRDSGKLSAEDHARMREETMAEAVQVLAEEETLEAAMGRPSAASAPGTSPPASGAAGTPNSSAVHDQVERMIEDMKKRRASEGLHT